MYKQENSTIMSLYAVSPVHAGSGTSMGVVDLPIQRERHTNWPHIQASGVKGAMRHHFEKFKNNITSRDEQAQLDQITEKIFGTDSYEDSGTLPGAIAVSDARLIAFPIRSSRSPFVWITCPAVLERLEKDFSLTGKSGGINIPELGNDEAIVINGSIPAEEKILLEDYEVIIKKKDCVLSETAASLYQKAKILLLVSNEIYHYGISSCTEIRTQIKIDDRTGTTVDGSLRYEELLPADSMMYVVLFYGSTRDADTTIPADILIAYMKKDVIRSHIQIGGDETLGCGLFQIEWI
ncbi:MAG: type III-B CRISPR module RAMP protein Cmr4 [Desulfobacula sp.]|jgi:CRISPR-associated protein Cmr4|nr:type III-B CRISPR module RAMP protein Cmr4 [Desulfobacula sp.]